MSPPVINEQFYDGGFVVSMSPRDLSLDSGFLDNATASDVLFEAGLVVVQVSSGTQTSAAGNNTGDGSLVGVSLGASAQLGVYTITMTSSTVFTVMAPSGDVIGAGDVGITFLEDQIGFTITSGDTAFEPGDSFTISVTGQAAAWTSWTGGDITTAVGILYNRVWVQSQNFGKVSVLRRNAEVKRREVQWDAAVSGSTSFKTLAATAQAALAANNIIAR